jgi:hypothetical protein
MLKKISIIFSVFIGMLIIFYACDSPPVLAQTTEQSVVEASIFEDVGSLIINAFASIPGLAALVLFITAYIKKRNEMSGQGVIIVSLLIALILSTGGYLFNLGIFNGVDWFYIFIYGLAACLIANGLADWNLIKTLLNTFRLRTGMVAVILLLFMALTAMSTITYKNLNGYNEIIKHSTSRLYALNMSFLN